MAKLDLTQYGITGSTVIAHNPSYEFLFKEETKAGLEGFDKGQNTELNAVNVRRMHRARTRYGGLLRSIRTITTP